MTPLASTLPESPVAARLRAARDAVRAASPVLAGSGALLALALIPSALALGLDDRLFNGVSVWVKPMKFQASLALHLLTVAALALLLPQAVRRSRAVRWTAVAMSASALLEAAYIALRAAQGQASHYAADTPLASAAYMLMGVGAVVLVAGAVFFGVLILRRGRGPAPLILGAGLGLVLGGVLGGVTGAAISANAGHWVGGAATDAGGLPVVGWVRDGGDLRVAHFFGMHLIQVLPVVGWLLWRAEIRRWRAPLWTAAGLGCLVTAAAYAQAAAGRPFW